MQSSDGKVVVITGAGPGIGRALAVVHGSHEFLGMSEAIRHELLNAGHPVAMSVVHPGGIKTALARRGRFSATVNVPQTVRSFDVVARVARRRLS